MTVLAFQMKNIAVDGIDNLHLTQSESTHASMSKIPSHEASAC